MIRRTILIIGNKTIIILIYIIAFSLMLQGCGNHPEPKQIDSEARYLIINGDDLCKDEETNQAIIKAHQNGILTSTSAMINLEGSAEQLKRIYRENPDLPVGLHLNLTFGSPVAPVNEVPNIINSNGEFYTIDKILKHLPDMPVEEVRKELFAQAELFVSTGVPLDHIDYHHHLAALYIPFFEIVRELAATYKVPVRNPVPTSVYNLINLDGEGGAESEGIRKLIFFGITHPFKSIPLIRNLGPEAYIEQEELLKAEGINTTHWFIDDFYNNASVENFISIIEQLPVGVSEIMCHPGQEHELEVLTSPEIKAVLDSLDIELINWRYFN